MQAPLVTFEKISFCHVVSRLVIRSEFLDFCARLLGGGGEGGAPARVQRPQPQPQCPSPPPVQPAHFGQVTLELLARGREKVKGPF